MTPRHAQVIAEPDEGRDRRRGELEVVRGRFNLRLVAARGLRVVGVLLLTAAIVGIATLIRAPDEPDEAVFTNVVAPPTTTPVGLGTGPVPTSPPAAGGETSTSLAPPILSDEPARIVGPDRAAMAPGASLVLEGLRVEDPEAAVDGTTVAVLIICTNGVLSVGEDQGVFIQPGRDNSAYLPMSGSLEDVNAALATLRYRPERTFTGTTELWVFASDLVEVGPADRPRNDFLIVRVDIG